MKGVAILLVAAVCMTGCSNATTVAPPATDLAPLALTAPVSSEYGLADTVSVGTSNAGSVVPLVAIPAISTNYGSLSLLAWGTKNAGGDIQALQEIAVYDTGQPSQAASLFFDASGQLTSIVEQPTGYSVVFSSASTTQVTATLCDPSLDAVAFITVTPGSDGNPQGEVQPGGSCTTPNPFALVPAPLTGVPAPGAGGVATNLGDFSSILQFITAHGYVAGIGFAVAAVVKFKQHKDNPTQVPLGTAIALLFIAIGLALGPSVIVTIAKQLFGNEATTLAPDGIPAFVAPP